MRRVLPLLLLLIAAGAPWAQAQVAVPEIGPGAVRVYDIRPNVLPSNSIVPDNPAALQWGAPSRLAAGALRGHITTAATGTANAYKGSYFGLRTVEPGVSLAAASTDYHVSFPNAGTPAAQDKQLQSVALCINVPDTISWGASATHYHANSNPGYPVGAPIDHIDSHGWSTGISWRLGEHLFAGGAYGQDKADLTGSFTGPTRRRHYMGGIALRGGGGLIWHLEADELHYDSLTDTQGYIRLPGFSVGQYTAEAILGSWLFSYTGYTLKDVAGPAPDVKGYTADFGISPLSGLNLTFRHERGDSTVNGTKVTSEEVNSVTLAWLF